MRGNVPVLLLQVQHEGEKIADKVQTVLYRLLVIQGCIKIVLLCKPVLSRLKPILNAVIPLIFRLEISHENTNP